MLTNVKSSPIARARGVVDWRPAFLSALETVGVICKAAESAQVSVMTVWRERKNNPEFSKAYDESLQCGALLLEAEAIRRARDGVVRMKFNPKTGEAYIDPRTITDENPKGSPYMEHEYSDGLMATLLKRHFPEYREPKGEVNVQTAVHNHLHITEDQRQQFLARTRQALGQLEAGAGSSI